MKVRWSDEERRRLVMRAAELHAQYPEKAPLELLRSAMAVLSPARRRRVRSLSQLPWFNAAWTAAIRELQGREGNGRPLEVVSVVSETDPYIPLMREQCDAIKQLNQSMAEVVHGLAELRATNERLSEDHREIAQVLREMVRSNEECRDAVDRLRVELVGAMERN